MCRFTACIIANAALARRHWEASQHCSIPSEMDADAHAGSSTASPIVASDDFTESAAWTAETEISANEVVEKEKLVR